MSRLQTRSFRSQETSNRLRRWYYFGTFLFVLSTGCGGPPSGPTRYSISGNATFGNKPIPKGFITFSPDDSAGNKGPGSGAEIVNGRFRTESGKGVVGGAHIVQIVGYDGIPTKMSGEELADGQPLFVPYVTMIDFPMADSTKDFDVPKSE